jgi:DnaK suppressor protein
MDDIEAHRRLADEQATTTARLHSLRTEFDAIVDGSVDANVDDEHDPEGSTIAFERALVSALMVEADEYLSELGWAADRLNRQTYAVCEACGGTINDDRLRARPASRSCVRCSTTPKARRLGADTRREGGRRPPSFQREAGGGGGGGQGDCVGQCPGAGWAGSGDGAWGQ